MIGISKNVPTDLEKDKGENSKMIWLSKDDFEVGRPLGKGAFGSVYLVRHRDTHFPYAMKVLFKKQITDNGAEKHVANEIDLQGHLDHPHIAKMKTWWQTSDKLFFIFEYCHWKTLFDKIQQEHHLEENCALKLFSQVVDAVEFCHQHKVIHRDIKPENILLWKEGHAKLSDFGWSACYVSGVKNTTLCGTMEYMAPELVVETGHTYKVDNWALGVLLYEMTHGTSPFASTDDGQCRRKIMNGCFKVDSRLSRFVEEIIVGLIKKMPLKRLELSDVIRILKSNM
ncbi:Protein kinase domain and Serine/threonine-/dual specificity protein kinase, catalytic domain and Protein kinase-like domain-containing protein [Strongyloides ratti]|uniref:Aurora kinase n=1 Tax=Strongyloides ratti TaxID=34506 RepID=A0A090LM83_STRRB|nr:Protein kinase domain and Serine/threonine-/dual specificity protein kinase, catalytic domain and Protein kinase-like domain-containing protein [Strongyloides ratti]CEF69268.1 Protein kinase domain and Serine/threonine-/dual specificity protein kinase, catalytic domain and Protein kinase-like domain-containing protein [Strongyloides ratti]